MASIEKRTGKRGTSYRITVTVGRDTSGKLLKHYKTYTQPSGKPVFLRKRSRKALRWITARRLKNTPGMFLN